MTTVVGGVYHEVCIEPFWDDVYGSAGRAAAAISNAIPNVSLCTYQSRELSDGIQNLAAVYGLQICGETSSDEVRFEYVHSLADPRITPRPDAISQEKNLVVEDDVVLRFGMMEGTAEVHAKKAVYDPQSAFDPRPFAENGSTAKSLALMLNRLEGKRLTGESDPMKMVDKIMADDDANVIVIKMGGHGALVATRGSEPTIVPAYKSGNVWKLGSGDVFSAAFTLFWGVEDRDPVEAAQLASRATSYYCNSRALPIPSAEELLALELVPVVPGNGRIYIAAPFFNLAERWIVEEVRNQLLHMGVEIFSPLHDVGVGPGEVVASLDLKGLDECDVVLAILNGSDAGTIFEIGYAVAKGVPVVALAQNMRPEDLKMPSGSGCVILNDLVSAIYHAVWALP